MPLSKRKPCHTISQAQACRIALHCQLLDGRVRFPRGKEGVVRVIEHLGYVQIDTIAVIERAHHHTLWTRRPDYDADLLHWLMSRDRRIFEYWGHAASYLPISDYRFCLPRMKRMNDPHEKWYKLRLQKCAHLMDPVLDRIRTEGPLCAKDFESEKKRGGGNWWEWKPDKIALELLFWRGDLMISKRRNFERVYDLTERVLPATVNTTMPTDDELGRFLVVRALNAYGVATTTEIVKHLNSADRKAILAAMETMVEGGEITTVGIRGDNIVNYAFPEVLEKGAKLRSRKPQLHILSPFDNLVILRDRIRRLFDFDYTIECYVPAVKRKYGYFLLSILWGEELVGRLDAKADRKEKTFIIKLLQMEPRARLDDEFIQSLAGKLREFAAFNGCEPVRIERAKPAGLRTSLRAALR